MASTSDHEWVALDFETAAGRRACAVGLVEVRDGRIGVSAGSFLIQPPGNAYRGSLRPM